MFVPVSFINLTNIPDWIRSVVQVIIITQTESMIRSVITVPNDFEKEILSYFASIPHLDTSPIYDLLSNSRLCPKFCINGNRIQL